ncbi:hypothetical protein [Hydrogenophaga sp. PAMC20947]|uniref:hypothetical protein n=1 Tax=Hydrogenophaga sp. PAMC20947 TaxID=2565558 RepID=UPI00109E0A9F|nr:hypothetical protein [Hydrogenophaga sp. PAMC20947]QCB45318.1 hypothetical protein E5678_04325 [Hydrogenophaga sp. PAMC20947]
MGIRFNTNTWRAPLQLIDCWLPLQPSRTASPRTVPLFLQQFARAGWLKPAGTPRTPVNPCPSSASRQVASTQSHPRHVRVHSVPDLSRSTQALGGRLALSGRIGDVCAELDRLAALEHPTGHNRPAVA